MSRRCQSSETRSRTLGDYIVGRDSRTCTVSSDSVGQLRKKKFSSPKCYCGSNAILFQSSTKLNPNRYFLWCPHYNLDMLVEENTEEGGIGKNSIIMARRLKEIF
ncbi:hypothetical protein PIB30_008866 [Stylosanthes scabra]|uniref:Zinc finger GRF-type domain-containing protein n=1 Tax=Stylosanthes scabra TaxID=79078 RepID=A0ABU6Z1R9_9FABA|nr:hypothetical protein [Stylosanthes scabra]